MAVCNCSRQGNYNRLKNFLQQKNNHDKLFKREELLNVVNELMRQSNDLATMERKVFEHNVKVYFGGLFENICRQIYCTQDRTEQI